MLGWQGWGFGGVSGVLIQDNGVVRLTITYSRGGVVSIVSAASSGALLQWTPA